MQVKFFYLPGCPYCRLAEQLLQQLQAEHPEYAKADIRRVQSETEAAHGYDFYYSPAFFAGEEKIYEAQPGDDERVMLPKLLEVLQKSLL
ncbi:MAG: hypothetical protein PHQ44_03700 [Anaerovibrio sp.]|nr:hypothetical protein [Anaerovibrio sp.]